MSLLWKTAVEQDDEPLYHGSHPRNREHIEAYGLHPMDGLSDAGMLGDGVTHAVFLTPDREEAEGYGSDVYQVDARGLKQELVDGPNDYHHAVLEHIPPHRIKRLT